MAFLGWIVLYSRNFYAVVVVVVVAATVVVVVTTATPRILLLLRALVAPAVAKYRVDLVAGDRRVEHALPEQNPLALAPPVRAWDAPVVDPAPERFVS